MTGREEPKLDADMMTMAKMNGKYATDDMLMRRLRKVAQIRCIIDFPPLTDSTPRLETTLPVLQDRRNPPVGELRHVRDDGGNLNTTSASYPPEPNQTDEQERLGDVDDHHSESMDPEEYRQFLNRFIPARGDVRTHDGEEYVYDPAAYPHVGDEDEP
jgi:hypothetical protein